MAEEKDKEVIEQEVIQEQESKFDDKYVSESYAKKFMKAGLLAIGASIFFKGKGKNDELLRVGATVGGSLLLSEDKDYSKDAIVLASLFGVKNAAKLAKFTVLNDMDKFKKVYSYAEKSDEFSKKINLAQINLFAKAKETFNKNLTNYHNAHISENTSAFSSITNMVFPYVSATLNTLKDSTTYLFKNGITRSLENINNNSFYNGYKTLSEDFKFKEMELLYNDLEGMFNLNIENIDPSKYNAKFEKITKMLFKATLGADLPDSEVANFARIQDTLKKYKKFQQIEESSFFTDLFGSYTKINGDKIDVRMDKILNDKMHFATVLNRLADNFKNTVKKDGEEVLDELTSDERTELFLDYLKKNGFEEVIEKTYNRNDLITFGEVNEMIANKSNGIDDFLYTAKKSSFDFYDDTTQSVKNLDILKDFGFTNVVKKTENGFFDETALNGHINILQTLGVLEKNAVGIFKTPILDKVWNTWNPFKLIDSEARTKNELVNNVLGMHYVDNDYIINGMRITEGKKNLYRVSFNKQGKVKLEDYYVASYTADLNRDAKVIFNKNLLSILGEDFTVKKDEAKNGKTTYTSLWQKFKRDGFKETVQEFTYSQINPFSFRYDYDDAVKKGSFRKVKSKDNYFKEGTFFTQYLEKSDIDIGNLRAENELLEVYFDEMKLSLATRAMAASSTENYIELSKNAHNYIFNKISEFDPNNYSKNFNLVKNVIEENILGKYNYAKGDPTKLLTMLGEKSNIFVKAGKITTDEQKELLKILNEEVVLNFVDNFRLKEVSSLSENLQSFLVDEVSRKGSIANKILREDYIGKLSGEEREFVDEIANLTEEYSDAIYQTKKHVNDLLYEKSATREDNYISSYMSGVSIEDKNNVFNPIYEILKGKKLNDIIKKYEIDDDAIENLQDFDFILTKNAKPSYPDTMIGGIMSDVKFKSKKEKPKLFKDSYKIYDKIEEELFDSMVMDESYAHLNSEAITNKIRKYSFDEMVKEYNQLKYHEGKEPKASAIIRQTDLNYKNMKKILSRVRESIVNLLSKHVPKEGEPKKLDSKANLLAKAAISQLQDALEYVGVERLPQKKLGDNGLGQIYNFMKYRYLPLAAIVGGAIAADTLSDALVPDDVPIVGNGVSGVAFKGIATARIGLQYALQGTGMLSFMRNLDAAVPGLISNTVGNSLDLLMSPEEMIDVYFNGKPIEVKANRWWFTAGRQSGEGEEFKQYRPHLFYIMQNKDSGIYSNKFEKLFRRDFALTKYPWYLLDPYKEEREAYDKYGAVYPMTEQLFAEIPVVGQLLNATIGEVIKPTQYIGEEKWRVGKDLMINPNYDPNDPSSPKYIEFSRPNKLVKSVFEAVEDLKTFAGIQGYGLTKMTEMLFGKTSPYQNEVGLSSIDQDIGLYSRYDRLQLGDLVGMTEPIRRLVDDSNALGMIKMNPLEQNLPDWMPDYFKKGNNPYLSWDFGNYILPSREFERNDNNNSVDEELNQLRVLSLAAPGSKTYKQLKTKINKRIENLSDEDKKHYYESLAFAENYGERDYLNRYYGKAPDIQDIQLKVDKKISPYEFISGGKRYKFDTVTSDFNILSKRYGATKATKMINALDNMFQEGQTYSFKMSQDASYSVGIDDEGDYFKIDSDSIGNEYNLEKSGYRSDRSALKIITAPFTRIFKAMQNAPMNIGFEKMFGTKDVYNEWSAETVQAPFFRDWDSSISSFVEPFYTYSSNSLMSAFDLGKYSNELYFNSGASFNALGALNKIGALQLPINKLFDNVTKSSEYESETEVHDELEKIKFVAGDKSFYNMTGKENLRQFSNMVNEQDAVFLKDLANVSNQKEREKILESSNERLATVLKTIWNRHQMAVNNTITYDNIPTQSFNEVLDVGAYYGNAQEARNRVKASLGITLSKLDAKRQGVFNAYRGTPSERESQFVSNRMYRQYNAPPSVISTIYGHGVININQRRGEEY